MYLDQNNLPVESNGDANDQLQRVGMILAGIRFNNYSLGPIPSEVVTACITRVSPPYARHANANPNTCSADQLISIFVARSAMYWPVPFRVFAQNTNTIEGTRKLLLDFMLIRALPIYARHTVFRYLADLLLIPMVLTVALPVWRDDTGFTRRSMDDVDDNNLIMTLALCRFVHGTTVAKLACWLYKKIRPINYGVTRMGADSNAYGALLWYHRPAEYRAPGEAAGNVEIALLWKPIIDKM